MDFLYCDPDELDRTRLSQGDLLKRTDDCVAAIAQAHQYYANTHEYSHFVVITQSCDLVRRGGNRFNAPYITIAAVKSLSHVLDEKIGSGKLLPNSDFKYRTPSSVQKARLLIERYINNTEDGHFFFPRSNDHNVDDDLVAFLRLSIALRKEHYDVLASAKIAQVQEVFQAKIGWQKGNIYSRVATPDLDERGYDGSSIKEEYYDRYIDGVQISGYQAEQLKVEVNHRFAEKGEALSEAEVLDILELGLPRDIEIIAQKIVDRLVAKKILPQEADTIEIAKRAVADTAALKGIVN